MSEIGILGAGGMAREAARYSNDTVAFFAVNGEYITLENQKLIDIENPSDEQKRMRVVAALGAPAVRRQMIELWPGKDYDTLIAETAEVYTDEIGRGVIIAPKAVVADNVAIGEHSIINTAATINHDTELGRYATVGPGAHIAGNVQLGDGVFVGIGAVISNGVRVAEGVVIGAGAVVTNNIDTPNSVVVGVPARIIRIQEGWLKYV